MKVRKQYTKEFKPDAVSLVLEQGYSRAEAARSLDIDRAKCWDVGCVNINNRMTGMPFAAIAN